MKNHRIFAKTWFRVGGISLVLGVVSLAMLFFNLPPSACPPDIDPLANHRPDRNRFRFPHRQRQWPVPGGEATDGG